MISRPRDSRVVARGVACMATWLEIAGRKQPRQTQYRDPNTAGGHGDAHLDLHCWIRICTGRRSRSTDFGTPLDRDEHILYRQATVRQPLMAVKPMTAQDWNLTMELEAPENAKQLTDNLKNIDKATQNMKADSAKYNRLAKEMVKGVTAGLGAVAMLRQ